MRTRPRSVWGRSLLAAVALHLGLAVYLLSPAGSMRSYHSAHEGASAEADMTDVRECIPEMLEAMATTHVVEADDAERGTQDEALPFAEEELPIEATAVEPDQRVVEQVAQAILDQAGSPVEADALGDLLRKSRVLEQISNADEVSRMSTAICEAIGVHERFGGAERAEPGGAFEFETAFVIEAVREEDGATTIIRESLRDEAGRILSVLTRRMVDAQSGEAEYTVALMRSGEAPEWVLITREEWDEAVARQEPYRVINQFPLVKLLHQEAVLPIMAKLSQESPAPASPSDAASER